VKVNSIILFHILINIAVGILKVKYKRGRESSTVRISKSRSINYEHCRFEDPNLAQKAIWVGVYSVCEAV